MIVTTEQYLYLTTTGWKSGKSHEIEIWYVEHGGCYYLVSELWEKSHWVKNIQHKPEISFRIADNTYSGNGRVIRDIDAPDKAREVKQLMDAKYDWSDGLIVELCIAD